MGIPNYITVSRLVLTGGLFALLVAQKYLPALVVFLISAGTDWIDGYLARTWNQITQLGRILDPFADKMLICGTFIFLAAEDGSGIAPWMAVLVMGRELLVTALRSFLEQKNVDFSAQLSGKLKMVFQCAAVVASLLVLLQPGAYLWLEYTCMFLVWLSVVTTIYSGAVYVSWAQQVWRQ